MLSQFSIRSRGNICLCNWHQLAYILLFTSQFTVHLFLLSLCIGHNSQNIEQMVQITGYLLYEMIMD